MLALRWDEINTKWRGLTIRDKVEGERVIPLTPYVSHLLHALPRRNEWVFSSLTAAGGVLTIPRKQHGEACAVAGIDGLTLHGLRRSFKSLTEWLKRLKRGFWSRPELCLMPKPRPVRYAW